MRGATRYYNAIYILFTYFVSFIGFEEDILDVISNLHVQWDKFIVKKDQPGGKSFKKFKSAKFMEFNFSKSAGQ